MDILLSVVVTVYNIQDYLVKCIESILDQTYKCIEVILVDDGSTDDSSLICDRFALMDNRVKVIHKINEGSVSARKEGVLKAKGDYVINIDGDDWIDCDRLENLVNRGLKSKPDMVYMGGYYKEYENESTYIYNKIRQGVYNKTEIESNIIDKFVGNSVYFEQRIVAGQWAWAVKRKLCEINQIKMNNDIIMGDDELMTLSCILDADRISVIEECGYHYRQRVGSIVHSNTKWDELHAKLYYMKISAIVNNHNKSKGLVNVVMQHVYHNIFLTNYSLLYKYYCEYLFPFGKVKNGSKIVVYGAGNIGTGIVNAIIKEQRFELVAWIDRFPRKNINCNYEVESISIINKVDFDYIVIAIMDSEVSLAVRHHLIEYGIDSEMIMLMDSSMMHMNDLDSIFSKK